MSLYLKKVLFFLALLMLVLVIASVSYKFIKSQYLADNNLKLKSNVHVLFLGDSHAETAFDDQLIPDSRNIAFHAEHYLFTYYKLKKMLQVNPKIDQVVLSFGPHNISQGADVTIFSESRNSRSFARYFMLLDDIGVEDTYSNSQNWKINYLKFKLGIPFQLKLEANLIYKTILRKPIKLNNFPFIGEFYPSELHVFDNVNTSIQGHYYKNNIVLKESYLAIKYLHKILKLAKERNVDLYLVILHYIKNIET